MLAKLTLNRTATKSTSTGIAAAVLAGALWGFVFLTPELASGFTSLQLSAGRYLAYGLIAAVLIAPAWKRLAPSLGWREWRALIWLSLAGNIVYYVLLAAAVQLGGVALASLVIGLLPLTVTLVGSRDAGALPLRRLLPSLGFGLAGLLCISWESLTSGAPGSLAGLLCAIGALVSWTAYAVGNRRWLGTLHAVSAHEWSLLIGVVTGLEALLLAPPAFLLASDAHSASEWAVFAGIVTGVALFCSVIGNALWNVATRALPLTLVGQMIVFETVFAVLYGFLWEGRWPTPAEGAAMVLLVIGVISSTSVHRTAKIAPPA
ncbi:DMT family transporter [Massilia sp. Dwa41.01b]|uniref:DMT family transporter n=1 Tax=unclassified Massilia TaxID=2609279 RepID=UPI0016035393|nr:MULTISPECIES: DMT family transporter [unclassified Massilia]QNA88250.1 DMT family transporter [Massilia sp. Dwa41.01b]QNA99150.1 DMT family transporter [Massilia sp. Se16.2.3]